jgi:predicted O-methyltransferase YrrM
MSTFNQIQNYYNEHAEHYRSLKVEISANINGRVCHHKIVVLNILVNLFDIKSYLEIGTHNGASMSYVVNQNKGPIQCYGIDIFGQDKQYTRYDRDQLSIERTRANIESNNKSNSIINLITGNSTSQETYDKVKGFNFDLIFIDGDHEYPSVKSDFVNYTPLHSDRGFVVLDDCEPNYPGVIKLSQEINTNYFNIIGNFLDNELIMVNI